MLHFTAPLTFHSASALGTWAQGDKVLLYLYYNHDSQLIDRRPEAFTTVVAYQAPALPNSSPNSLADWACSNDPMLLTKGSDLAKEHLSLENRLAQAPLS